MALKAKRPFGSATEFAQFGKRSFAYMRPVKSQDMNASFPDGPELPEGLDLWALFAADGQPIAVSDEMGALVENAEDLDLMTLPRH